MTLFWRDPAMPFVESRRACDSRACYKAHSHPDFSIGAIDRGVSRFTGACRSPVVLHAGTVVFVPPERIHACNPVPGTAWSYQMLHLDAAWVHALRQEYAECARADEPVRIRTDAATYVRFCRLNALLFSPAGVHAKEAALVEFVGDCDAAQGVPIDVPPAFARCTGRLGAVLDVLRRRLDTPLALAELAGLAGMSRYQLIRAFRAATGTTPHAWQLNRRIGLARARIRAGDDIATVAHGLGFADQAHFQRAFKAHAGVTPGCYRSPSRR